MNEEQEVKCCAALRKLNAEQKLEYLMQSETVRLIMLGRYTPEELDRALRNMRKRIREQEHVHQLDLSEVVSLRRQIELLTEVDR